MIRHRFLTFMIIMISLNTFGKNRITTQCIDWKDFLSQHDLVWDTIPSDYYSGAILGNGLLGTNIYKDKNGDYRWDIGRSDITESRKGNSILFDQARLPIGHFVLSPKGEIQSENMRLILWDATATGNIKTNEGRISFKTLVHAEQNIISIETCTEGKELDYIWSWKPEEAISPRMKFPHAQQGVPQEYKDNPNPTVQVETEGNFSFSIQQLYSGKTYVTAWHITKKNNIQNILITVSFEDSSEKAKSIARQTINNYLKQSHDKNETNHRAWWHNYYPASFASFQDIRFESFYWIQQYKLASATRSDKLIIDLQGPWTNATPWPAIWWNLNTQLTYSPLFTANRLELSQPVWKAFDEHLSSLINNVPIEEWRKDAAAIGRSSSYNLYRPLNPEEAETNMYEVGNLTWMLYYYWQYCIYKPDSNELLTKFFPLLKRSIAYYSHIIYKGNDNKWHLPLTASPEYKPAKDCNYDLSLLNWGLNTLLTINQQYNLKDSLQNHWEDVLQNLIEYPTDNEQGFIIGQDVKLESSHRHYSHLLMIYPLHLVHWEQPENRSLIEKSINHWLGLKGALQGYTFTGAASMYASMGDGNKAVDHLEQLFNKFIQPNTLYKESGPVIETPLSAVTSQQELYLQSWGGKIRVFPAVPANWQEAAFINFRAEGGFLISGLRQNGATTLIQIEAMANGACKIQTGMKTRHIKVISINGRETIKHKVLDQSTGLISININKGEIIQIISSNYDTTKSIAIEHPISTQNYYGVRKKN